MGSEEHRPKNNESEKLLAKRKRNSKAVAKSIEKKQTNLKKKQEKIKSLFEDHINYSSTDTDTQNKLNLIQKFFDIKLNIALLKSNLEIELEANSDAMFVLSKDFPIKKTLNTISARKSRQRILVATEEYTNQFNLLIYKLDPKNLLQFNLNSEQLNLELSISLISLECEIKKEIIDLIHTYAEIAKRFKYKTSQTIKEHQVILEIIDKYQLEIIDESKNELLRQNQKNQLDEVISSSDTLIASIHDLRTTQPELFKGISIQPILPSNTVRPLASGIMRITYENLMLEGDCNKILALTSVLYTLKQEPSEAIIAESPFAIAPSSSLVTPLRNISSSNTRFFEEFMTDPSPSEVSFFEFDEYMTEESSSKLKN